MQRALIAALCFNSLLLQLQLLLPSPVHSWIRTGAGCSRLVNQRLCGSDRASFQRRFPNNLHSLSSLPPQSDDDNSSDPTPATTTAAAAAFDLPTALIMAGYAFDSYNSPTFGKLSQRVDGVRVVYPSTEFTSLVFRGILVVTLEEGSVKYDDSSVPLLQRILNGRDPDPYIRITSSSCSSSSSSDNNIGDSVITDSIRSSTKMKNKRPDWKETHFLLIDDFDSAEIEFAAFDEQNWGDDVFIGNGFLSIRDLMIHSSSNSESYSYSDGYSDSNSRSSGNSGSSSSGGLRAFEEVTVPIPLYADRVELRADAAASLSLDTLKQQLSVAWSAATTTAAAAVAVNDAVVSTKRIRTGTIKARLQLIPWYSGISSSSSSEGDSSDHGSYIASSSVAAATAVVDGNDIAQVFDFMAATAAAEVAANADEFQLLASNFSALVASSDAAAAAFTAAVVNNSMLAAATAAAVDAAADAVERIADVASMRLDTSQFTSPYSSSSESDNDGNEAIRQSINAAAAAIQSKIINSNSSNFSVSNESGNSSSSSNGTVAYRNLPKGASGELALWENLLPAVFSNQSLDQIQQQLLHAADNQTQQQSQQQQQQIDLAAVLSTGSVHKVCSIEDPATDTQVVLWADVRSKLLVVSFRGTEMHKLQDIITDLNFLQTPLFPEVPLLSQVRVHRGFRAAYMSVRDALLQQLYLILSSSGGGSDSSSGGGWRIYCTGHSLGAALTTLFAFDIARLRAGLVAGADTAVTTTAAGAGSVPQQQQQQERQQLALADRLMSSFFHAIAQEQKPLPDFGILPASRVPNRPVDYAKYRHSATATTAAAADTEEANADADDAARYLLRNVDFRSALDAASLVVYNYGSPRVGNSEFKRRFDSLVGNCFRVVNQQDVVARLPRSSKASILLDYEHVGRTALISELRDSDNNSRNSSSSGRNSTQQQQHWSQSSLWVQGASAGSCPLEDVALLATDLNSSEFIPGTLQQPDLLRLLQTQFTDMLNRSNSSSSGSSSSGSVLPFNWISILDRYSTQAARLVDNKNSSSISISISRDSLAAQQQQKQQMVQAASTQFRASAANASAFMDQYGTAVTGAVNSSIASFPTIPNIPTIPAIAAGFVDRELQLLYALVNLTAVEHHLEPAYYSAFKRAVQDFKQQAAS